MQVTQDKLYIIEMEERNDWARLELSLYFAWFGLQFTVNAAAFAALFAYKPKLALARIVIGLFMGWNVMGTAGSFLVCRHLRNHTRRITELLCKLTRPQSDCSSLPPKAPVSGPRAPVAGQAISLMLIVCMLTMVLSLAAWTLLQFCPRFFDST
jgi:hypothetical protein